MDILFRDNDNLLEVLGVRNGITTQFINSATATVTVTDLKGIEISGASWPLTLSYVTGSDGDYRGVLPDVLILPTTSRQVAATIIVDGGVNLKATFKCLIDVRDRKC